MAFVVFLVVALLGAFVQTVTGFALGLIVVALAAGLKLVSLPVLLATASLLSLVNVLVILRTQYKCIDRGLWGWVTLGQVPAIGVGLLLMMYLNEAALGWLQFLLGLFVLFGSVSMLRDNVLLERPSGKPARFGAGLAGGLCGGMFSASGPVMGWFFYRQPLALDVLRATLLACFGVTTSVRTVLVAARGELTAEIGWLVAASIPMIVLGTWLGNRYASSLQPEQLRRGVFVLLTVMGIVICAQALSTLLG